MGTTTTKPILRRARRDRRVAPLSTAVAVALALAAAFMMIPTALAQGANPSSTTDAAPGGEASHATPSRQDAGPHDATSPGATPHDAVPNIDAKTPLDAKAAPGRYSFSKVDGGVLRLDTVTGEVSACSQHGVGWVCQAVPQERAALEREIGRLQGEVAGLKAEVAALRATADASAFSSGKSPPRPPADLTPRAGKPDHPPQASPQQDQAQSILPSKAQIDNVRAALQSAWQRLVDMIVGFKNEVMKKG